MALRSGTQLGPYEIVEPLGAGGMGEVYRARDTRLDRSVAVKVLPSELSADIERRSRFEREARAIASLTHPHICTLYDVGRHGEMEYLVMELLQGRTLAERLQSGRIPLDEVLTYAIQIASALDTAHRQGVVHRDLKPANVMLTRSGAKLLDFGVAKLRQDDVVLSEGMTRTAPPLTGHGQIVGTLHYMAPEQLEGKPVDARTDIFAFGVMVYEMSTGRRPFEGDSQASLIGAILHAVPPPVVRVAPAAPPALDRVISVCLSKDPEQRWFSAHDVLLQLKSIAESPETTPTVGAAERRRVYVAWAVAAIAGTAALILAGIILSGRTGPSPDTASTVLALLPPAHTRLDYGQAPLVSPDGQRVAFVASDGDGTGWLYIRNRDSPEATPLPGTEEATLPFWAPDSRQLGFFSQGQLKIVSMAGGVPHAIAPAPVPRGATWNRDDVIVFVPLPAYPPQRVRAGGGPVERVPVRQDVEEFRWFPSFLPDGQHYLFLGLDRSSGTGYAISVGSLDSAETTELVRSRAHAVYADPGYLVFRRDNALVAQAFDADTRQLKGQPVAINDNVGFNAVTYQALFSVSNTGLLTYVHSTPGSQLVWFDRHGNRAAVVAPPGDYNSLCLTFDESRVVYDVSDPATGNVDLWAVATGGGTPARLTFDPTVDFFPVCSPTGQQVMFASLREGAPNLFQQVITAPGREVPVLRSPVPKIPTYWSRDGKLLVYSVLNPKTNWDIEVLPLGEGQPFRFATTEAEERNGRLSPNGRWMAYMSNESGRPEVYVQPFPPTGAKWQISKGGGLQPHWRGDGRELFYLTPSRKLVSVTVATDTPEFAMHAARELFDTRAVGSERTGQGTQYAVDADGQRFLISTATDVTVPVTVVQNWPAALRR